MLREIGADVGDHRADKVGEMILLMDSAHAALADFFRPHAGGGERSCDGRRCGGGAERAPS